MDANKTSRSEPSGTQFWWTTGGMSRCANLTALMLDAHHRKTPRPEILAFACHGSKSCASLRRSCGHFAMCHLNPNAEVQFRAESYVAKVSAPGSPVIKSNKTGKIYNMVSSEKAMSKLLFVLKQTKHVLHESKILGLYPTHFWLRFPAVWSSCGPGSTQRTGNDLCPCSGAKAPQLKSWATHTNENSASYIYIYIDMCLC